MVAAIYLRGGSIKGHRTIYHKTYYLSFTVLLLPKSTFLY
jgi:hypothetical protein